MELSIDTSTEIAGIALSERGELVAELCWHTHQNHTIQLVPAIDSILVMNKASMQSLSAIFVARGPGSFNGLRVGVSSAKGFAFALNVPLVSLSTLEIEAYPFAASGLPVCAIHGAGRGEIAAATYIFDGRWHCIKEQLLTTPEELAPTISTRTIFVGEIPEAAIGLLQSSLGDLAVVPDPVARFRRPGFLAKLAWDKLEQGLTEDPSTLQPVYLRLPPITERKVKTPKK
jgi:tRNA threonylcarbamoyl adenosine modification protein YeaZ